MYVKKDKIVVKSGEGTNYNYSQNHCFIKLSSRQTRGELSVVEAIIKPDFYLARHHHKIMTEIFYILEGEIELIFDDKTIVCKTGDTVTVPPKVWHAAQCKIGSKMLCIYSERGRFDVYLEKLSRMTDKDFANEELKKQVMEDFDIYEI